jgi:hypothetical protein
MTKENNNFNTEGVKNEKKNMVRKRSKKNAISKHKFTDRFGKINPDALHYSN